MFKMLKKFSGWLKRCWLALKLNRLVSGRKWTGFSYERHIQTYLLTLMFSCDRKLIFTVPENSLLYYKAPFRHLNEKSRNNRLIRLKEQSEKRPPVQSCDMFAFILKKTLVIRRHSSSKLCSFSLDPAAPFIIEVNGRQKFY